MKINKTNSFYNFSLNIKAKETEPQENVQTVETKPLELKSKFNDHLISFRARVDKGLERFYEVNKDRMPYTVKTYVKSLEDKTRLTPLEAQKRAFSKLENAKNVTDIKKDFLFEPLFSDLIQASESKAKRGILQTAKENEELLALSDEGILKDKSDLTVYLVKKIFLEGKTVDEINTDLESDLNEDFKADFKFKNKTAKEGETPQYIYTSTLKALGIKTPSFEYQQSLRYTKDGYSDAVGEKISAFWDSLPANERVSRAKKSVEKFENWWSGLSQNEKIEMIADQLDEIELLKKYKKNERALEKEQKELNKQNPDSIEEKETKPAKDNKVKVGSSVLSKDDLFKLWAKNNLKIYEANLSEAQKDTLHLKRMQRLTARWTNMTPAQRTDYISKMKSGAEPLRYTMIDAWNHSTDLLKKLSSHLKENQVYKPADLLYSTDEFSNFQSKVMTEFWENNPDLTKAFGQKIVESQEKVNGAIERGTFEALKNQINRDKKDRIREVENFKTQQTQSIENQPPKESEDDYKKAFVDAYNSHVYGKSKSLPKSYFPELLDIYLERTPQKIIESWTKNLRGDKIPDEDVQEIINITANEPPRAKRCNRAIEAAIANVLYQATKDPVVFFMPNPDAKVALFQLEQGEKTIEFKSQKNEMNYNLKVVNSKVDLKKVNFLYEEYKKDLTEDELDEILDKYFTNTGDKALNSSLKNSAVPININGFDRNAMRENLALYGKSALILFSEKSAFPIKAKNAFYQKFVGQMPESLKEQADHCIFSKPEAFTEIEELQRLNNLFARKFDFVPRDYIDSYFKEIEDILKNPNGKLDAEIFETKCCKKRTSPSESGKLAIVDKKRMPIETKLKTLAMEQALADVLYEATGNMKVYSLPFEELAENIEIFSLVKKFPSEKRTYKTNFDGNLFEIQAQKKVNTFKINKLYREYLSELESWSNEELPENENPDVEDILFILNPEENNNPKDFAVLNRILQFGLDVKVEPNKPYHPFFKES